MCIRDSFHPWRQGGHGIVVGLREQRTIVLGQPPKDGIGVRALPPGDRHRAVLSSARIGDSHLATEGLGEQLMSQADRQRWYVGLDRFDHQLLERLKPRVSGGVMRAHRPAQDEQPVAEAAHVGHVDLPQWHGAEQDAVARQPGTEPVHRNQGIGLHLSLIHI